MEVIENIISGPTSIVGLILFLFGFFMFIFFTSKEEILILGSEIKNIVITLIAMIGFIFLFTSLILKLLMFQKIETRKISEEDFK